ncbi:hypothetical protein HDU84_007398 [Entophlyctis sp. JEL0112]|nr:hypothetical protein HDU84_007398 [Entophlyctis sp. JEL0112]
MQPSAADDSASVARSSPCSVSGTADEVFTVDRILDDFYDARLYKVRWEGYGKEDDTWEPESSFIENQCIEDYLTRKQLRKQRKVVRVQKIRTPKKTAEAKTGKLKRLAQLLDLNSWEEHVGEILQIDEAYGFGLENVSQLRVRIGLAPGSFIKRTKEISINMKTAMEKCPKAVNFASSIIYATDFVRQLSRYLIGKIVLKSSE